MPYVKARLEIQYNLSYFSSGGALLQYDFFRPLTDTIVPLFIFLHGGGWISGDKSMFHEEAAWLAQQGYACACVQYRFAPEFRYPSAIEDVQSFVRTARRSAKEWRIDPVKIVSFGHSAGGHLALMVSLVKGCIGRETNVGSDTISSRVNCAVALSPITDMTDHEEEYFLMAKPYFEQFMPESYEANPYLWQEASPVFHVDPSGVPTLLLHGNKDELVPCLQSKRLCSELQKAQIYTECQILQGEGHSYTWRAWETIRSKYLEFVRDVFPINSS